jgi:membrane associated rhomboid family serine protease
MNRMPQAVRALLIVNIVVFATGFLLPDVGGQLVMTGALWFPANDHFGLWQVVSYMFLHGSPGHIFFNMFALVSFGKILEREWGASRFFIFYFLCVRHQFPVGHRRRRVALGSGGQGGAH